MKDSQKIYAWPWVIAIVALFLIGAGIYSFSKTKDIQVVRNSQSLNGDINKSISNVPVVMTTSTVSTVTSSVDQYLNGKTYTNSQFGFSFKYPDTNTNVHALDVNYSLLCTSGVIFYSDMFGVELHCQPLTETRARDQQNQYNSNFELEKTIIAGKTSYVVSYFTATDYHDKIAYVPVDDSHYISIMTGQKGNQVALSDDDWKKILNSIITN